MHQRTSYKLGELKSFAWFSNVGCRIEGDYRIVRDWKEAVELSDAVVWNSVQLQVKNRLGDEVTKRDYKRSQEWNAIAGELRKHISAIIADKVEPLERQFRLSQGFRGAVSWDILSICLETEFSDLVPPKFFVPRLEPVYAAGHFPCGWEGPELKEGWKGDMPNARLIVY
jgi:hypothetical protein